MERARKLLNVRGGDLGLNRGGSGRGAPRAGAVLACLVCLAVLASCSAEPERRGDGGRPAARPRGGQVSDAARALPGDGPVSGKLVVRHGAFAPTEGSGVVASRAHAGVLWAIRDGGSARPGQPRAALYAYRLAGDRVGALANGQRVRAIPVPGVTDVDWEDIAADDRGNLWIADIGNNDCRRASIALYKVREPDPAASRAQLLATYRFTYPDPDSGCRGWDAESLFLVDGMPYVITKSGFPVVYRPTTLDQRRTTMLRRVGGLGSGLTEPVLFPTGADLSDDHRRLAVATYATLAVYQVSDPSLSGQALVSDLIGHPARWTVKIGCLLCAVDQLSMVEGVAFTGRDHDLTLLSERHDVWYAPTAAYERGQP
jgi:hypothetical protein